jgi:hypothetical protein
VIPAGIFVAFFVGLIVEAFAFAWSDRRAVAREAAFWEELRAQALDGYGRVFDWSREPDL